MPLAVQMIVDYVQEVEGAPDRLVLVVGKPGSGKSKMMRELATNRGWRYINCRELVTDELLELVPKARPQEAPQIMGGILTRLQAEVILLDNLQVLFTPMLNLDPLAILKQLGRKHTLIAAWPGAYEDGSLTYLELGQSEPHRYPADEVKVIEIG
ncbi:MAG TPA: BREX-3 system P-loop-containing protein BrxF [Selenomonadales bacterium]|nr:BREX-3 system P-loop-containing protein BrxF [Selenomonadales bacterium]